MTKALGQVRMTKEFVQTLLGLPEEIEITSMTWEAERELMRVIIRSEEPVSGYTFLTGESQEITQADSDEVMVGIDIRATQRVMELALDELSKYKDDEQEEE